MRDLLKLLLALDEDRPPNVWVGVGPNAELLHQESDYSLQRHAPRGEMNPGQRLANRYNCSFYQRARNLQMRRRVRFSRLAKVVVAKDPVLAVFVELILHHRLLDLQSRSAFMRSQKQAHREA